MFTAEQILDYLYSLEGEDILFIKGKPILVRPLSSSECDTLIDTNKNDKQAK